MRPIHVAAFAVACATGSTDPVRDSDAGTDAVEDGCPVVDCADPACADAVECTWPTEMFHEGSFRFTGAQISCSLGGGPLDIPIDVPDCATEVTATLTERTGGDVCTACDRTFEGPLTYVQDTCSELLGQTPPTEGAWGFVFVGPTERELWLPSDGGWAWSADLALIDGVWTATATERVEQVPPDCGTDVQYLGDVTIEARFTDR